jgi:Raf kinase inhibitor-like YbhB/YbcL family protein
MTYARLALSALLVLGMEGAGCQTATGPQPSAPLGGSVSSITVTSKSVPSDQQIPVDFSCDGKDVSPQLTWSAPPEGTKALVIIVNDPNAGSGTFTHWIVINLAPDLLSLAEGADPGTMGAKIGLNDFKNTRYNGPCPPRGSMHKYQYRVYAADYVLPLGEGASRADVDAALAGHVLGAGEFTALFSH